MKKVVVITGATTGLGLSLAAKFLQSGDQVFGISKTKKHWASARKRLGHTKQLELFQLDVTSESGVARFFDKLKKQTKRVDVVINNAGYVDLLTPVDRLTLTEFRNNIEAKLGDRLFFEDINRIKVAKIHYKLIDARKLVNELCKHLGASYSESMKANSDD